MKIIKPEIEIEDFDGIQIMKNIELACRTAELDKREKEVEEKILKIMMVFK